MPIVIQLLARFWYIPAAAVIAFLFLIMRNEVDSARAAKVTADRQIQEVSRANQSLIGEITQSRLQRTANDTAVLAAQKAVVNDRIIETHTETVIEKAAQNDTKVRAWVDTPLPDSVRAALASGKN